MAGFCINPDSPTGSAIREALENEMLERAIKASLAESSLKEKENDAGIGPSKSAEKESVSSGKRKAPTDDCETQDGLGREIKKALTSAFGLAGNGIISCGGNDEDDVEFDIARCTVQPENIRETFAHVHANPDVIEALDTLTLSIKDPEAFQVGILAKQPSLGVLLYGPPGTGKTLLVRAVAKQANAKVIAVSGADIRSKYVGVGERRIKSLFAQARKSCPCIIFIDEADSIFHSRSSERNTRGHVSDITQFLAEMEGISSSQGGNMPMVIAATNRPFDMDEGVLRRLGRRIRVDVPDRIGRERILNIHLAGEQRDPDLDLREVAEHTNDFTGSDLRDLVWEAAMQAVREIHWHQGRLPQPSETVSAQTAQNQGTDANERPPEVKRGGASRVLRREHFLRARQLVSPAPKADLVAQIADFHSRYGSTGGGRAIQKGRDPRAAHINKVNGAEELKTQASKRNVSSSTSSSSEPSRGY